MTELTTDRDRPVLTRTRTLVVLFAAALVVAFWVGTHYPQSQVKQATCDTTDEMIQCYPEGERGLWVVVNRQGIWQDSTHTWRSGLPDCLPDGVKRTDPVQLAVVEGGDDGMAWESVVWVGCP